MSTAMIKELLEAGAHFGHQSHKWNPKMREFIFDKRNGVHIINLEKTAVLLEEACTFVTNIVSRGSKILFVGTKIQAKDVIQKIAEELEMPYVSERWLGGMLTNLKTIRQSVEKMNRYTKQETDGVWNELTKKEQSLLQKEKLKLCKYLSGVKDMRSVPDAILIVDPDNEDIAVNEARRLNIPIIAILDTNCDPDKINYCVPSNDDSIKSNSYILGKISEAAKKGMEVWIQNEQLRKTKEEEEKKAVEAKKEKQRKKAAEAKKAKETAEAEQKAKADAIIADLEKLEKQK